LSQHSLIIWGVLMARRGRKRRLDVESEYWRLLLSGVGTVEACRRVGIGSKHPVRVRGGLSGCADTHDAVQWHLSDMEEPL
jgi:hypothetical protein